MPHERRPPDDPREWISPFDPIAVTARYPASILTETDNNCLIHSRALDAGRVHSQPHLVAKPSPFRRNGYLETGKRFAHRPRGVRSD